MCVWVDLRGKRTFCFGHILAIFLDKKIEILDFILEKNVFSESCTERVCTPLRDNPGVKIMLFSPLGALKMAENGQKWKNGRRQ